MTLNVLHLKLFQNKNPTLRKVYHKSILVDRAVVDGEGGGGLDVDGPALVSVDGGGGQARH